VTSKESQLMLAGLNLFC